MGPSPGRLGALNEIRARRLAASLDQPWAFETAELHTTAVDEMVALHDGQGCGFALVVAAGPKAFGSVMIWAARFEVTDLTLMVDAGAGPGDHARRATAFGLPPTVMAVDGTRLVDAEPALSRATVTDPPAGVDAGTEALRSAGLDVVVDDGVVVGEYLGLEVARVVPSADGGEVRVGVGAVDQEANRALHAGSDQRELLVRVVADVAAHRRPGVPFHPLNRMARERWLMRSLIDDRSLVGVRSLVGLPATEPRRGLRTASPVGALADTPEGRVLVVATAETDVSLIGVAADLVVREEPVKVVVVSARPLLSQLSRVIDWMRVPVLLSEVACQP